MIDEIRILSCSEPALLYSPPAETRLTVYRRLNILEQFQLVAQIGGSARIGDISKKNEETVTRGH